MPKTEFDYYYGAESEQFSFVRVPRVLFTDKEHSVIYPMKQSFCMVCSLNV